MTREEAVELVLPMMVDSFDLCSKGDITKDEFNERMANALKLIKQFEIAN